MPPDKKVSSDVPLIPRRLLFGNPDRTQPKLSHDGKYLAFLAPVDGVLNVWVGPPEAPDEARPVTRDTGRGIRVFVWPYTSDIVLYLQDKDGDENWRLYATALETERTRDLTPFESVQARTQQISPDRADEILVALNNRGGRYQDIHRVNIRTGEMELVQENEGFLGFITDDDYAVRFANRFTEEGDMETLRRTAEGEWEPFIEVSMEDSLRTGHVGFDESGEVAYWSDRRGRDTAALVAIDLETRQTETLAHDPCVDVGGVMRHPTRKHPQAVAFTYTRRRWEMLDPAIEDDFARLSELAEGDFSVRSRTLDDRHWIVGYTVDDGPQRFYRYDRETAQTQFLFADRDELADQPLVPLRPQVVESRDGLDLVCYLSLPKGTDPDGDDRPETHLPTVLVVHGGPWGRDTWGFNPWHQWLANRGYAVLSVNFRGFTGFGKEFLNAGNMEWAGRMHDDLIDAVEWAQAEGITDADRTAIMGGSYGGYATLVGLTFTPEVFACGVDIVGPSNLVTLLESIPPYWVPMLKLLTARVGDPGTEEGRALLEERSPLNRADRIRRPLLIGQGAHDPRVKQAESDQIVSAMQEKDIAVTYVVYPDEGHGFARPENRISFFAVAEAFLSEHLGGRREPVGDDVEGSSITVPVSAGCFRAEWG